jgi:hypothetical protein
MEAAERWWCQLPSEGRRGRGGIVLRVEQQGRGLGEGGRGEVVGQRHLSTRWRLRHPLFAISRSKPLSRT